jgi:c-di-AMP phosphodiesterase-like protein
MVQIDSKLIKKHIENASSVVIMAHCNMDLDALGSSLGLYYLCKALDKSAYLLIDDIEYEDGVKSSLDEIRKQEINIKIKKWSEIEKKIDNDTLLIVVDAHLPYLVQNEAALGISNVIIIDHHIHSEEKTISSIYEYIGEEQSSSVEIIIELLRNLDVYIHPYIATIMLAGIFVDTHSFFRKTNYKTHEAAAYLYKCGAIHNELQYLLKEDIEKYNDMQQIIREAIIVKKHFVIAIGHENKFYSKEDLAKISDTTLLFKNIEASFTIGKIDNDIIDISARSLGNINVEAIMKKLDGGGHSTDAATQLKGTTLTSSFQKIKNIIDKLEGDFR